METIEFRKLLDTIDNPYHAKDIAVLELTRNVNGSLLFDPNDKEFLKDPYRTYKKLRHDSAVYNTYHGFSLLMQYNDVKFALQDLRFKRDYWDSLVKLFGEDIYQMTSYQILSNWMVNQNPPEHLPIRRAMAKVLTQQTVEQVKLITPKLANRLIDNVVDQDRIDLLRDYANPLSTLVMCDMLGIPIEDTNYFLPEEEVSNTLYPYNKLPAGLYSDANAYIKFLNDYFSKICAQRRAVPGNDPISLLISAYDEEQKDVTDDYLISNIFLLFSARENTYIGMTTLLHHLYKNPAQLALLKNNYELIYNAIDEALRFDPPLQISSPLIVTEDIQLESGFKIKQGSFVLAHLGSASHDENAFEDPDRFDITKQRRSGVHFGRGFHFCIGASIARAIIEIALKTLFERLPNLQVEHPDDPKWCPRFSIRGLHELKATTRK